MGEKKYLIKEAAKLVEVEPHVLRYWEEELDIKIKRNDMGHRYYDEQDIRILQKVKELKDRGIQLKAIHELVKKMYELLEKNEQQAASADASDVKEDRQTEESDEDSGSADKKDQEDTSDERKESPADAFASYDFTKELVKEATQVTNVNASDGRVVDFKLAQFQAMMTKIISNSMKESMKPFSQAVASNTVEDVVKQMDVLLKEREEREEARYKKLDATLREMQQTRREIAASEMKRKKKFGFRKK